MTALSPMTGMWVNCIYGGKGVGMINMLLFLIIGVFIAGQMVERTPEYLGRKVGAREMKLAMIGLLIHPMMILGRPAFSPLRRGGRRPNSIQGPRILRDDVRVLLGVRQQRFGLRRSRRHLGTQTMNPNPARRVCACGIFPANWLSSRDLQIVLLIAMWRIRGMKQGYLWFSGDHATITMASHFLLLGTIVIIGALLFLPVAALGPASRASGTNTLRRLTGALGEPWQTIEGSRPRMEAIKNYSQRLPRRQHTPANRYRRQAKSPCDDALRSGTRPARAQAGIPDA